jgi:hypothetical protein
MANTPPVYQTSSSVSSSDLVQLWGNPSPTPVFATAQQFVSNATPIRQVYNTITATTTATLAAASIVGASNKVFLGATGTLANATGLTLPTVAATVAAITPAIVAGQTYELRVINKSSANFTITVLTSTGWTLSGSVTVGQNTWRDFLVTFTSLTAATLQEVGTGTDS